MNGPRTYPAGIVPRGIAYLADCVVVFLLFAATQALLLVPVRQALGIDNDWFASGVRTELYTLVTVSIPAWLYFSLTEASPRHATLGKRWLGLRVVPVNDHLRPAFARYLSRTVLKLLPWELAHLANNLPVPMWCAANPQWRWGFFLSGTVFTAYALSVAAGRRHRALYDRWLGFDVVRAR